MLDSPLRRRLEFTPSGAHRVHRPDRQIDEKRCRGNMSPVRVTAARDDESSLPLFASLAANEDTDVRSAVAATLAGWATKAWVATTRAALTRRWESFRWSR